MKHQLSKVATIATLAFIGIGFAGTQQAKAGDCPKFNCDSDQKCITNMKPGCQAGIGKYRESSETQCANCDDDKDENNKCIAHMVYIGVESTWIFGCDDSKNNGWCEARFPAYTSFYERCS